MALARSLLLSAALLGGVFVSGAEAKPICGVVSFYGTESGDKTATGEHFDGTSITAAMPDRSHLGEVWKVTWKGRSVTVRINDVGPRADLNRIMDLSKAAAKRIGLGVVEGVARGACITRVK